ncbi:NAD(P)H-binding protein [Nocardiopsis sp. NPDC058631]|uniref:NAD(P)H-binding protein n=1 Tax=Nocardiopsis sp. NPDC058631 TaxID=3346566 RepID=UPI0036503E7F
MAHTRNITDTTDNTTRRPILVVGATGKTGRRVVARLRAAGHEVRAASRSGEWPFDWNDRATWGPALEGVETAYVVPFDPAPVVRPFVEQAEAAGLRRIVLLSGRGIDDPDYLPGAVLTGNTLVDAEDAVVASGLEWTLLRPGWYSQNFDEGFLADLVRSGEMRLPTGDGAASFVDVEDIAEVAVAALTGTGHAGRIYELSGPSALTMAEVAAEISAATGRTVDYVPLATDEFVAELVGQGVSAEDAEAFAMTLSPIPRGKDAHLSDGVRSTLGREPRAFGEFARKAAEAGAWSDVEGGKAGVVNYATATFTS